MEELSNKYPDVVFLKVNAETNKDISSRSNVKSFPTFHFYINGAKVDEMSGANPQKLENMVTTLKASAGQPSFASGSGHTLGAGANFTPPVWDGVGDPPVSSARAARLKAFGHLDAKQKESIYKDRAGTSSSSSSGSSSSSSAAATAQTSSAQEQEDEAIAKAIGNEEYTTAPHHTTTTLTTPHHIHRRLRTVPLA